MKIQQIKIGVICDRAFAKDTMMKIAGGAHITGVLENKNSIEVDTISLHMKWIQPGLEGFKGCRLNYVYTTEDVADSEWFKTIIKPMICGGWSSIGILGEN